MTIRNILKMYNGNRSFLIKDDTQKAEKDHFYGISSGDRNG
jgi:hypothetical protein